MKYFTLSICILLFAVYLTGCKKCFHCTNSCQQCAITINSHTFTQTLCVDSFNSVTEYNAAIAHDTAIGYTCAATNPTYSYDFCVNQPGEKTYPDYFNRGNKATCNEK